MGEGFRQVNDLTTNTLERFIKEVKRRTKVIEVFPTERSVEKVVYLVSVDMNEKYERRKLRAQEGEIRA